jgi:hypothetical protein
MQPLPRVDRPRLGSIRRSAGDVTRQQHAVYIQFCASMSRVLFNSLQFLAIPCTSLQFIFAEPGPVTQCIVPADEAVLQRPRILASERLFARISTLTRIQQLPKSTLQAWCSPQLDDLSRFFLIACDDLPRCAVTIPWN